MTDFVSVYITVAAQEEADQIAQSLVQNRLAACVNIVQGVKSLYHWQGAIEESHEIVVIAKTRVTLFEPLCEAVKALHSYETPCIVAQPIIAADQAFLEWMMQETKP